MIVVFSANSELLLQRFFRNDVTAQNVDAFRINVLTQAANRREAPIVSVDRVNFMYIKTGGLYLVAASRKNVDVSMVS